MPATTTTVNGAKIRALRIRQGLTVWALHEITNINASYLSAIERGLHNPSPPKLLLIANALNVTVADLIHEPRGRKAT